MPEEHNRIEIDRLSQLLFAPDERSRAILEREGVAGRVEVVGDVMVDANFRLAPLARERSAILETFGVEPGTYVVATIHREANVVQPRLGRLLQGLGADRRSRSCSPPIRERALRSSRQGQTPEQSAVRCRRSATSTSPRSPRRRA